MVFVNDKKYACETCIKGHRSSSCIHTDRPLFEIKKKGRPITQCEHCRQLRKTKQVHVKCLCEGREDPDAVSHSIPAKKANRRGPTPSAAFPYGIYSASASASDSEDAPTSAISTKAAQRIDDSPTCACKSGGPCECCTLRHNPRPKRSATPPSSSRPKIGDIRATAPAVHRPPSDVDDGHDVSYQHQYAEHGPHVLSHGHGARSTHGTALFNPYGPAHDAHLRAHDMRGHEADNTATSKGYIYPVPPISYSQQQSYVGRSDPPNMWSNGERLPDDFNDLPATYDTASECQPDLTTFGAVDFGSVDVDAWLREMMVSTSNLSPNTETDAPSTQPSSSTIPYSAPQPLPVPEALDVSQDLAQLQEQDYATASSQYDLLPRLVNLDLGLDYNDNFFNGSDQDVGDVNGIGSGGGTFDSELLSFAPTDGHSVRDEVPELLNASAPFSAPPPPPPMLTLQSCANGDFRYAPSSAASEPRPQEYAFDYLATVVDPDYVVRPSTVLPALTRSSSIGSHSSGRSRSSMGMSYWARNASSERVDDQWHSSTDASYHSMGTAESSWGLPAFPSVTETARGWPATRVQAYHDRGRAPTVSSLDVPSSKD